MSLGLVLAAALAMAKPSAEVAPGTLNYLEGQASVNGEPLTLQSVRTMRLGRGEVLSTQDGNAELLLTPGVFLRLGHDSAVRMISPGLANTRVELLRGRAMVEADQLYKQNNLEIVIDGSTTRINKTGLYEFDASQPSVMVFNGKARVFEEGRKATVKGGHELALAEAGKLKPRKFNRDEAQQEPLYRWSELRNEYESRADTQMARNIYEFGGWYGPGWYWDPYWSFYAYLPGSFYYGPFGYPFYGPGFGYPYPVVIRPGHGRFERGERGEARHGSVERGERGEMGEHGFGGRGSGGERAEGGFHGGRR